MIAKSSDLPTILVCVDTTNASEVAIKYACYKAKITGFAVQILAVMEASHKNILFGAKAIGNDKRSQLEKHLKKIIDMIHDQIGIMPVVSIREGDIVTEIVREIKSLPCCAMLVLGKSSNTLSDNIVLPKITQKIGSKIKIPVVVVPEILEANLLQKML